MMHIDNRSLVSKLLAISDTNEVFDQHGLCIGVDDGVTGWQCTKPYTKLKPKTKTDESQFSVRKRHLPPLPLQWKNISQFTPGAVKPAIVKSEKLVAVKTEKPQCAKERKKLNKKRLEKLVAMTKHCTDQDTKCLSKPSENIEDRLEPTIKPPPGIGLSPKDAEQRYLPSFMNQIPNLDRELLHDRIILNRLRTLSSCSKRYGYGLTKIALHYGLAGPELRGKVDTPKLPTVKTSSSQSVEPHGKKRRSRLSNNGKNVKIKVDHIQKRLKDLSSHVLYPNQASESKEKEKKEQWVHVQYREPSMHSSNKANMQSNRMTLSIPESGETGDGYDWKFAPLLPPILNQHIKMLEKEKHKRFYPKKQLSSVTAITQANQKVGMNTASILRIKRSVVTPVLPKVSCSSLQETGV